MIRYSASCFRNCTESSLLRLSIRGGSPNLCYLHQLKTPSNSLSFRRLACGRTAPFPTFGSRVTSRWTSVTRSMGEPQKNEDGPENFRYVQLWVSADGESHIKECKMTGFKSQAYSSLPQFVREEFGGEPQKIIFTELSVGLEQSLHTAPEVQFVVTLSGSWYIKTTDGAKHVFKPGDVLFQDNTKKSPAEKLGQHESGTVGEIPCQQLIVQINRKPEVDNPNPF